MSIAFYYIIPIFILTIILLIYRTEFIFPLLLIAILLFKDEIDNTFAISVFGIGSLYFGEVFLWVSFLIFILKMKSIKFSKDESHILKLLIILYFSYVIFIVISVYRNPMSPKDLIQNVRTFFPELAFFSSFCYVKLYGYKRLFSIIYFLFIIFNVTSIITSLFTENVLHNAFLGLTSSYILIYTIYLMINKRANRLQLFFLYIVAGISISLPFLGSTRGAMISISLTIILVVYYFSVIRKKYSFLILIIPFIVISAFFVFYSLESELFYSHLGSNSLYDLVYYSLSSKEAALNYRDVLWETLIEKFEESPFFGAGYFQQIKYMSVYGTALMAHNYFIYRLAAGGIFQIIFVLMLYYSIAKRMFQSNKRLYIVIFAISNIMSVIVINLSNVHFASLAAGSLIWTVMGASTCILYSENSV